MIALLWLVTASLASPFKSKCQLELENVALRHQVMVSFPKMSSGVDSHYERESAHHLG
jgi:hypothetical protein